MTICGRHVFDMTDGWDGKPPGGIDHVVVVTHRPAPEGWDPEAPFHFVDGVEAAVAKAQELAGDRVVEVAAGDVGGQALAAGLIDEVRMDVVPVVFGSGKRYFGSVHAQHLLEDPDVVQGQPGAPPALSGAPFDLSGYGHRTGPPCAVGFTLVAPRATHQHHRPPTAQIELIRYSIAAGQCHSAGAYGAECSRSTGRTGQPAGGHRFGRGWG